MAGIYCNKNNWKPMLDNEDFFEEFLMPIYLLSPFANNTPPLPTKTFNLIRDLIPEYVNEIRKFWLPRRQQEMAREKGVVIANQADRIGRNEPCPCGSAKKFKKCCGKWWFLPFGAPPTNYWQYFSTLSYWVYRYMLYPYCTLYASNNCSVHFSVSQNRNFVITDCKRL